MLSDELALEQKRTLCTLGTQSAHCNSDAVREELGPQSQSWVSVQQLSCQVGAPSKHPGQQTLFEHAARIQHKVTVGSKGADGQPFSCEVGSKRLCR